MKLIRVKATVIFLAWMVIFLHGVIPHVHIQDQPSQCFDLVHSCNHDEKSQSDSDHPEINGSHSEKVCHFPGTLFQHTGYDDIPVVQNLKLHNLPVSEAVSLLVADSDDVNTVLISPASPFRAPPAA
ncbi:MAG: hypothetical protein U0X39_09095 [Bacteroidales bacterium]